MNRRGCAALVAVLATFACFAAAGTAATPLHLTEAQGTFPERTYVLSLPAGQRLETSGVRVTENGHGVVGLSVKPASDAGGVGSGTVLAIDASNSMRGAPIIAAIGAARSFAARRNVNQRLAILTFNASTNVLVSFTTSQDKVNEALAKTPELAFRTELYDAVAQAIALVRTAGIGAGSVIVLSDGADVGSTVGLEQVIESAKIAHVRIFTVGLRSKTFRPEALEQLANTTGGSFSTADSPTALQGIYDQLGLQLAQEYIVSYHSVVKPGRPVDLKVEVDGVGTTSAGYVTPTVAGPGAVFHKSRFDRLWQSALTMVLVALLVPGLVALAVVVPMRRRGNTVRSRVSDYVTMPQGKREGEALVSRVFTGTERSLEKTRWWSRFKEALQFADVPIPPVQVVVGTVVLTLIVAWILGRATPILAVAAFGIPLLVRALIVARMSRKRRAFGNQLPDNLDVLSSGLRAGHSLIGALSVVVADAGEPSRTEFQHVIADEQLGIPLQTALDKVVERMRSRDLEQVALVAAVQSETGANAAEVLDRVTESIRERQDLRLLVRALTAQGRLARWVVSLLPVGLLLTIEIINPDYMKPLFHHTSGIIALAVGVLLIVSGSVVIGRIVDIEV